MTTQELNDRLDAIEAASKAFQTGFSLGMSWSRVWGLLGRDQKRALRAKLVRMNEASDNMLVRGLSAGIGAYDDNAYEHRTKRSGLYRVWEAI